MCIPEAVEDLYSLALLAPLLIDSFFFIKIYCDIDVSEVHCVESTRPESICPWINFVCSDAYPTSLRLVVTKIEMLNGSLCHLIGRSMFGNHQHVEVSIREHFRSFASFRSHERIPEIIAPQNSLGLKSTRLQISKCLNDNAIWCIGCVLASW